jgi:hypothetical protein
MNVALCLVPLGRGVESIESLEHCLAEFENLGMPTERARVETGALRRPATAASLGYPHPPPRLPEAAGLFCSAAQRNPRPLA